MQEQAASGRARFLRTSGILKNDGRSENLAMQLLGAKLSLTLLVGQGGGCVEYGIALARFRPPRAQEPKPLPNSSLVQSPPWEARKTGTELTVDLLFRKSFFFVSSI